MFRYDRRRAKDAEDLLRESEHALLHAMDTAEDVCRSMNTENTAVSELERKLRRIRYGLYEDAAAVRGMYRTLEQIDARYEGLDRHLSDRCDRIPSRPDRGPQGPGPAPRVIRLITDRISRMSFIRPDPSFWKWILMK